MLSKKNYLDVNKVAFANLNKQQKEEKYKKYQRKFQNEKSVVVVNTNNVKKPTNRNNNNVRVMQVARTQAKWSDCLLLYAKASIDPFDNIQRMPCIPDSMCSPSNKFKTFIDSELVIGTTRIGYAILNPWAMASNDNVTFPTYTDSPLITTTAAYDSNVITWDWDDIKFAITNANSPYSVAQLETGVIRLVAAGMEIEYTGQLLDQSGTISVVQWDGLRSLPNLTTISEFKSNQRTQTCATSREARCYVRYEPMREEDFSYSLYQRHLTGAIADPLYKSNGIYGPLAIVVNGAEPGTTFRVRAVAYFEAQLPNLPSTPSESDPIGFPAFQAARTTVLPTQDPKQDLWTILKNTAYNIGKSITGNGPQIGAALGAALGNPAAGAAIGAVSKNLFESLF